MGFIMLLYCMVISVIIIIITGLKIVIKITLIITENDTLELVITTFMLGLVIYIFYSYYIL